MKNWVENVEYTAERSASPRDENELRKMVLSDRRVKALGSRHPFNRCADTAGTLVDMRAFDPTTRVLGETVQVTAGATYADVARAVARMDWHCRTWRPSRTSRWLALFRPALTAPACETPHSATRSPPSR